MPPSKPAPPHTRAPKGYGKNRRWPTALVLWFAVMAANVVGILVATGVSVTIRGLRHPPESEVWLLTLYYGAMIIVGVVDALWIDEVVFKGAFRRTHLSKKRARSDVDDLAVTLQRSDLSFPLVVLLASALTYGLFNLVNRGFDEYHDRIGAHFNTVRTPGDDPELRKAKHEAIAALSINGRVEVIPFLLATLESGDPEIAAWSAWAIGRHREMKHRRRLIGPLRKAVQSEHPRLRREALLALARLQHRPSAEDFVDELRRELDATEQPDPRLFWGLAYMQVTSALPQLERALYHEDLKIQAVAAWAAAQLRDQKNGRTAVDALHERLPAAPFSTQCAIVHALGILADERSNLVLIDHYDDMGSEDRKRVCSAITINLRPDGKGDDQHVILITQNGRPNDIFVLRTLEAMGSMRATSPEVRAQVEPWLKAMSADMSLGLVTRQSAQSLLQGIEAARNDSRESEPANGR